MTRPVTIESLGYVIGELRVLLKYSGELSVFLPCQVL